MRIRKDLKILYTYKYKAKFSLNDYCIIIHYSATSAIYYYSPCKSLFKVLTIEFRRGKLTHLRTEDTFVAARRRCGITKPEIASESNSS